MKLKITEEQKKEILGLYNTQTKKTLIEQAWLRKLIGTSVDDLVKLFGDDAVKTFETLLSKSLTNPMNYVAKNGQTFLKSMSGMEIPMSTIQDVMKVVSQGKVSVDEVAKYLPSKLADGLEFREVFRNSFSKKTSQGVSSGGAKVLGSFEIKFLLNNCSSSRYCDTKLILNNFYTKLSGSAKLTKFDPSKVKILSKSDVAGREVIEVTIEDGSTVLFYKSSGSNVATTGKQSGEWFVIPGFAENGWFFKTQETINFTKGGNKYLTDMADFLKSNGSNGLGKTTQRPIDISNAKKMSHGGYGGSN